MNQLERIQRSLQKKWSRAVLRSGIRCGYPSKWLKEKRSAFRSMKGP